MMTRVACSRFVLWTTVALSAALTAPNVEGQASFRVPSQADQARQQVPSTGAVRGRVTDENGNPLTGTQVVVDGTSIGTITNSAGTYTVIELPTGPATLVARMIGFSTGRQSVVLQAGDTATVDFVLAQSTLALDEVVVDGAVGRRFQLTGFLQLLLVLLGVFVGLEWAVSRRGSRQLTLARLVRGLTIGILLASVLAPLVFWPVSGFSLFSLLRAPFWWLVAVTAIWTFVRRSTRSTVGDARFRVLAGASGGAAGGLAWWLSGGLGFLVLQTLGADFDVLSFWSWLVPTNLWSDLTTGGVVGYVVAVRVSRPFVRRVAPQAEEPQVEEPKAEAASAEATKQEAAARDDTADREAAPFRGTISGRVFLSYARDDRTTATYFAKALRGAGLEVFWDRDVPLGKSFSETVEVEIELADAVIALFSRASVSSQWVLAEARSGLDRDILFPVLIDDVSLPMGFQQIQAIRLQSWDGNPSDQSFQRLLRDLSTFIERGRGERPTATATEAPEQRATPEPPTATATEAPEQRATAEPPTATATEAPEQRTTPEPPTATGAQKRQDDAGPQAAPLESVRDFFDRRMPERLRETPELLEKINGSYKFDISGEAGGIWVVHVVPGQAGVREGDGEANCTIRMSDRDFIDLVNGRLNPQMAFMSGKMKIAGDMSLALKVQRLFS